MKGVNLMERESMLIYKSFIDVSESLNDTDYRLFWDAIHKYGIYGKEVPKFENATLNALMVLILPLMKANIRNYENGCKGGAPKGNKNAKSKTTQKQPSVESGLNKKTTQKQGNVTVNDTDTVTDTLTDNEKEKNSSLKNPWVGVADDGEEYIKDLAKYDEWNKAHEIVEG